MNNGVRNFTSNLRYSFFAAILVCTPCTVAAADTAKGFDQVFELQGIIFHVTCPFVGSLNQLEIKPGGLETDNSVIKQEVDGSVTGAVVADMNEDGSPEIYVFVNSAGSGTYGSLIAYNADDKKSLRKMYLPQLDGDAENSTGYMGHDEFAVIEGRLIRRFPIYNKGDSNANPTGGTRQLQYKMVPVEEAWQLKLVKNTSY